MNRLQDAAREGYVRSWGRYQSTVDPTAVSPPVWRQYGAMFTRVVSMMRGGRVLDLGCGNGNLLYWLSKQPGITPVGIDLSTSMIETAKHYLPDIEILCADGLEFLREHPSTFNGIFCKDVLEHLPDMDLCLDWVEAARDALVPGGVFYCRVPNAANLIGMHLLHNDLTHHRSFTQGTLLTLLELGGLTGCSIIPMRAADLGGKLRLRAERLLHEVVFRICGEGTEKTYTRTVAAVGRRE